jgi:hypothetical protein
LNCGITYTRIERKVRLHIVREDVGDLRGLLYSSGAWECKKCGSRIAMPQDMGMQLGNRWMEGKQKFERKIKLAIQAGRLIARVDVDKDWI